MVEECERLSKEWKTDAVFDVREEMRRLTLAIVGATLFGADFRNSAEQVAHVLRRVTRRAAWLVPLVTLAEPLVLAYRRLAPNGPSLFFPREHAELRRIIAPIIDNSRSRGEKKQSGGGKDVLSLILNQQESTDSRLTEEDVRNEIVTFVLAGHETTSVALTWTWHLLARHPEARARMQDELDKVLGERVPTMEDTAQLPYIENVFKESMRLYPPALLFARRPKWDLDFGGYRIRRGQSIFVSPYITQRNPAYFERPQNFEPDRWNDALFPKFAYFPFGGGAKMCIGEPFARLEGVLALATLGRKWVLNHVRSSKTELDGRGLLNPNEPIVMRATERRPVERLQGEAKPGRF
jgi:cytochrome P450